MTSPEEPAVAAETPSPAPEAPSEAGAEEIPAGAGADEAWTQHSYSLGILGEMKVADALAHLESRLDSVEIDLARRTGSQEDESRRIAGEHAVMKARVEDALGAVTEATRELREAWVALERRLAGELEREVDLAKGDFGGRLHLAQVVLEVEAARLRADVAAAREVLERETAALRETVEGARGAFERESETLREELAGARAPFDRESETLREELAGARAAFERESETLRRELAGARAAREEEGASLRQLAAEVREEMASGRAELQSQMDSARERLEQEVARLRGEVEAATVERPRLEGLAVQVREVRDALVKVAEVVARLASTRGAPPAAPSS